VSSSLTIAEATTSGLPGFEHYFYSKGLPKKKFFKIDNDGYVKFLDLAPKEGVMGHPFISEATMLNGKLHSFDDYPAVIMSDGMMFWFRHGEMHRDEKPAVIWRNGNEDWLLHNKLHRWDGPARVRFDKTGRSVNETSQWYANGESINIEEIIDHHQLNPNWKEWTDGEKMIVRLAVS
jgi:hypothetical protein